MATALQLTCLQRNQYAQQRIAGNLVKAAGNVLLEVPEGETPTALQLQRRTLAQAILRDASSATVWAQTMLTRLTSLPDVQSNMVSLAAEPQIMTTEDETALDTILQSCIAAIYDEFAVRMN